MELVTFILFFPFSVAALIAWLLFRYSKKNRQAQHISPELAQRQMEYMRVMNTCPRLLGSGDYSTKVVGDETFQENLQTVREMLLQQYTTDSTFMAVLQVESETAQQTNAVRVSVGDETVGYLPPDSARRTASRLVALGGKALAEARFANPDSTSDLQLLLDLVVPIKVAS